MKKRTVLGFYEDGRAVCVGLYRRYGAPAKEDFSYDAREFKTLRQCLKIGRETFGSDFKAPALWTRVYLAFRMLLVRTFDI